MTNTPLLPGYPVNNPVLTGLARVLAGDDVDEALFERDQALPTPEAFCSAAWDALSWMAWPNTISLGLLDQLAAVAARLPAAQRRDQWGAPLTAAIEGAWQVARARAEARHDTQEQA